MHITTLATQPNAVELKAHALQPKHTTRTHPSSSIAMKPPSSAKANPLFHLSLLSSLFVVATVAQDMAITSFTTTAATITANMAINTAAITVPAVQLAPPWLGWTVTDDNVMGGRSSSTVAERSDASLAFQGTVSFDRNGGFSGTSSHGGGSYRLVQLFNNRGNNEPVPLDLSRFGEDGGIRVTFRGDNTSAAEEGPRAINLNIHETGAQMNFGGFSPRSTSSSFVVYASSEPQSWFLPFSTFMGTSFLRADGSRGLPLASLSNKLGMQVGSTNLYP